MTKRSPIAIIVILSLLVFIDINANTKLDAFEMSIERHSMYLTMRLREIGVKEYQIFYSLVPIKDYFARIFGKAVFDELPVVMNYAKQNQAWFKKNHNKSVNVPYLIIRSKDHYGYCYIQDYELNRINMYIVSKNNNSIEAWEIDDYHNAVLKYQRYVLYKKSDHILYTLGCFSAENRFQNNICRELVPDMLYCAKNIKYEEYKRKDEIVIRRFRDNVLLYVYNFSDQRSLMITDSNGKVISDKYEHLRKYKDDLLVDLWAFPMSEHEAIRNNLKMLMTDFDTQKRSFN